MAEISKISGVAIADVAKVDAILKADIANINGLTVPSAAAYLLDTYTGAAAAYSVRRLNSLYTGACMRVRRDSDNTEQDIGFDSNGDLDTAAIASFVGSGNNGYVRKWYGQESSGGTGSGLDAEQATAASQPLIYNGTAVLTDNGKPAIQWDGTDDSLAHTFASASTLFRTNLSFFLTHNVTGGDTRKCMIGTKRSGSLDIYTPYLEYDSNAPSNIRYFSGNQGNFTLTASSTAYSFNAQRLASVVKVGTTSQDLYVNGSSEGSTSSSSVATETMDALVLGEFPESGGLRRFGGTMQEVVMYDSDESSNRTGIEGNINTYFSIY